MGGALRDQYEAWRDQLKGCLAHAEAVIDFGDDEVRPPPLQTVISRMQLTLRLSEHLTPLRAWCKQYLPGPLKPEELRSSMQRYEGL